MSQFKDVASDAGLAQLNTHLSTRSYIDGFKPSKSDVELLARIAAVVNYHKYPHVARWLAHVTSFDPHARAGWTGVKGAGCLASAEEQKGSAAACPVKGGKAAKKVESEDEEEEEEDDDEGEEIASIYCYNPSFIKACTNSN
jgi:elongation factor 1-beta